MNESYSVPSFHKATEPTRKSEIPTSVTSKKQNYGYFEMLLRKELRKLNANDELPTNVDGVEIQGKGRPAIGDEPDGEGRI